MQVPIDMCELCNEREGSVLAVVEGEERYICVACLSKINQEFDSEVEEDPKSLEINKEEAEQILQWWGLSDSFYGQELAARLENFTKED